MTVLEAFQQALIEGADDDALDVAAADVRRDSGAPALVEAIKMRIAHELGKGKSDLDVTALRFRLAFALEDVAKTTPTTDGATAALEAAALCREVLNDSDAATRNLVHALKWGANDDATLRRAIVAAGGGDHASHAVEKVLKRPEVKADAMTTALLRRTLSRIAEAGGDRETAFFEMLKAARKAPADGLSIDDVNRLALATGRNTEAAAFFGALADDESLAERQRATILNKLGQTLERTGDKLAALEAYTKSLRFHEAKAPKRAVERLAQELGVEPPRSDAMAGMPIGVDEPPDVTPPYDHKSGTVTLPETKPLTRQSMPPPPPPSSDEGDAEISEEDVVSAEAKQPARHGRSERARAEVTIARQAAPDAHLRTAELHETMPPSLPSGLPSTHPSPQPRAIGAAEITQSQQAPRPISVPRGIAAERSAAMAPLIGDDVADANIEHALAPRQSMRDDPARLPSFDDEPALTPERASPGLPAHDERIERARDLSLAPPPSLENSDPALPPAVRRGPQPILEPQPVAAREDSFPPAASPFPAAGKLDAPQLEAALAKLPDRGAAPDQEGKTRRVPLVAGMKTAINTFEGNATGEGLPSTKRSKKKEGKKEKTQKRKRPIAPGAAKMIVDNSSTGLPEPASTSSMRPIIVAADDEISSAAMTRPSFMNGDTEAAPQTEIAPAVVSEHEVTNETAPPRPVVGERVEATIRSPAPQPPIEQVVPTAEAMPPLAEPAMSMPSMEASTALARALAALDNGSVDECVRAADELARENPGEPRVLRLAARALSLDAELLARSPASGAALAPAAVALFVAHASRHGDRAATMALEVRDKLPGWARRNSVELWLAGARAAGADGGRVLDLLRDAAIEDAPDGPAFSHCERVLAQIGDAQARDALYQAALKHLDVEAKRQANDLSGEVERNAGAAPAGTANAAGAGGSAARGGARKDDGKRAAVTRLRIALLEGQSRPKEALPLHAQLAVDLQSGDIEVRRLARRAFTEHGTPDERARFLARLARRLPGDEGLEVAQELLDVRLSVDDRLGAEAAAKDLLARRPGDARGTKVLADLLEDDPARADELADILRIGAQQALAWFGKTGEARAFLERLAGVQARAGRFDAAADALVQVARLVPDQPSLDKALAALDDLKRYKDEVALLEEAAGTVADTGFRARTLLRAAEIARQRLQKRGKARELVERALDVAPRDREALRALADLLVEIGDVPAAVSGLERLAAEERDPKERARTHLRIGRLLEEHLLKQDEALKRYRAAADMDPASKDVWNAIRAVARQRGESALLVESLKGLAGAEQEPKEKATLWRQIAKVERDERADAIAAEKAFVQALAHDASDAESLGAILSLLAARLQPDVDLDSALAQPNEALMEAVRPVIVAGAARTALPLPLRRLHALALSRGGDRSAAAQLFEQLLVDHPEDLDTMMAFARHLAAAPRAEIGAEARRLRVLETILLHHAYSLKPPVQIDVWGDVTALRAATGDGGGARKAAKKVMALALTDDLKACISDRAVRAVALALDDARDAERDAKAVVAALRLDADRSVVESERARLLERAAAVCAEELKDLVLARQLLELALRAHPQSVTARDQMLDLDLAVGDVAGALKQVRDLLARESDPPRKAALHLRMFRLRKKLDLDVEGAAVELKAALDLDPTNDDLLATAEQFFNERKDADGLDKLWTAQLRSLDREDPRARLKLLERLAQLRRYDRRDFAGAIEALEAMTSLDPEALKPREDAARLYTELGLAREAVGAWRGVLERDPLSVEAWRGVLGRFSHARQGDEAFAVASTMLALDIADLDIARVVRTVRPPFPRWPLPPKDPALFRKKIAHPLERTPIKNVLDVAGPRLLPLYARELKSFGLRRKDALAEKNVPTSVLLAVRTLAQLLNLKEIPPLYAGEVGVGTGAAGAGGPPFAALPSMDAGIIVTAEVLKGGMTPERAFALGRAASWLQPHAVLAAAVDAPTLRLILEGLVAAFLGPKNLERPDAEAEQLGKELGHALMKNRTTVEESAFKGELLPALRDYVHARQQVQVADWRAGVGYSGDRVGFLMSTDLNAAFRMIKASTGGGQSMGARLAIKELVLFSVSSSYLGLRKDLGLALPELAAAPLLELG